MGEHGPELFIPRDPSKPLPSLGVKDTIRFLGDMERLETKPGDVYVVTTHHTLSAEACEVVRREVQKVLGPVKVLVMSGGIRLGVVGGAGPLLNSAAPGA